MQFASDRRRLMRVRRWLQQRSAVHASGVTELWPEAERRLPGIPHVKADVTTGRPLRQRSFRVTRCLTQVDPIRTCAWFNLSGSLSGSRYVLMYQMPR
jgi:hypothetical protein